MKYESIVLSFMSNKGYWKKTNEGKTDLLNKNKVLREIQYPDRHIDIMRKLDCYFKSPERLSNIRKIVDFAKNGWNASDNEYSVVSKVLMQEIICATGCRSIVVRHLPIGSYKKKKPGFNPFKFSDVDKTASIEGDIWNLEDPSIPAKDIACKHQLESNSATCYANCESQAKPDGFNILVWSPMSFYVFKNDPSPCCL